MADDPDPMTLEVGKRKKVGNEPSSGGSRRRSPRSSRRREQHDREDRSKEFNKERRSGSHSKSPRTSRTSDSDRDAKRRARMSRGEGTPVTPGVISVTSDNLPEATPLTREERMSRRAEEEQEAKRRAKEGTSPNDSSSRPQHISGSVSSSRGDSRSRSPKRDQNDEKDRDAKRRARGSRSGEAAAVVPGAVSSTGEHKSRSKTPPKRRSPSRDSIDTDGDKSAGFDDSHRSAGSGALDASRRSSKRDRDAKNKERRSRAVTPGAVSSSSTEDRAARKSGNRRSHSPHRSSARDDNNDTAAKRRARSTKGPASVPGAMSAGPSDSAISIKAREKFNMDDNDDDVVAENAASGGLKTEGEHEVIAEMVEEDGEARIQRMEIARLQAEQQVGNTPGGDSGEMDNMGIVPQEEREKPEGLAIQRICCLLLVILLIGSAVVGVMYGVGVLRPKETPPVQEETATPTVPATNAPTAPPTTHMPSSSPTYLVYNRPDLDDCELIRTGQDLANQTVVDRNYALSLEVDLNMVTNPELMFDTLSTQIQTNIMPKLAGCPEFQLRRRLKNNDPLKYWIRNGVVITLIDDGTCEPTSGEGFCFKVQVDVTIYVADDQPRNFYLIGRISDAFKGNLLQELGLEAPFVEIRFMALRTLDPTEQPSPSPSMVPSVVPSMVPTVLSSSTPTTAPVDYPTTPAPTNPPSAAPSGSTGAPTPVPPTPFPTKAPTPPPTSHPTDMPAPGVTPQPSNSPSETPSSLPSDIPSDTPSVLPSSVPSGGPTLMPTSGPTSGPTKTPTPGPTPNPSNAPTQTNVGLARGSLKDNEGTTWPYNELSLYTSLGVTGWVVHSWNGKNSKMVFVDDAGQEILVGYRPSPEVSDPSTWNVASSGFYQVANFCSPNPKAIFVDNGGSEYEERYLIAATKPWNNQMGWISYVTRPDYVKLVLLDGGGNKIFAGAFVTKATHLENLKKIQDPNLWDFIPRAGIQWFMDNYKIKTGSFKPATPCGVAVASLKDNEGKTWPSKELSLYTSLGVTGWVVHSWNGKNSKMVFVDDAGQEILVGYRPTPEVSEPSTWNVASSGLYQVANFCSPNPKAIFVDNAGNEHGERYLIASTKPWNNQMGWISYVTRPDYVKLVLLDGDGNKIFAGAFVTKETHLENLRKIQDPNLWDFIHPAGRQWFMTNYKIKTGSFKPGTLCE